MLSLRRGNWKSWTSSAEISVHMCAGVCLFWVLGQRFIASMHTHACTHTSHTHGKQRCRDPSMSTSQAQPSIHFSQWPRNEWQDKQKPPRQVYKSYHWSESVYRSVRNRYLKFKENIQKRCTYRATFWKTLMSHGSTF